MLYTINIKYVLELEDLIQVEYPLLKMLETRSFHIPEFFRFEDICIDFIGWAYLIWTSEFPQSQHDPPKLLELEHLRSPIFELGMINLSEEEEKEELLKCVINYFNINYCIMIIFGTMDKIK